MSSRFNILYVERHSGRRLKETVFADRFLYWAYNTRPGWLITRLIISRRAISRIYGWFNRLGWSRRRIKAFAQNVKINLDELTRSVDDYSSFNDFFTREIDLSLRPIVPDPNVCIAPVDGRVLAYPHVEPDQTFSIKRSSFNLRSFLKNDKLSDYFSGGAMVICRLSMADYHHFHFPDSGTPGSAIAIPGLYHAGGPYSQRRLLPFYRENYRMITLFDSDNFGRMALVEIGALTVGSIRQQYLPGTAVTKGAHKGFFELGGSTVVMLFKKGTIELDQDLIEHTRQGLETYVKLGDSVGRTSL